MHRGVQVLVALAGAAVAAAGAFGSEVTLSSGEVLNGAVTERTSEHVKVSHPVLGELTIPASEVEAIDGVAYEPPVEQIAAQPEDEAAGEAAAPEPEPEWTSSLTLGLNGSEGNTENLSLRAGLETERLIKDVERFKFTSRYKLDTDDGDRTENEWYNLAIQEWYLPDHPKWSWFLQGDAEYDEFQDWDVRVSGTVGLGYLFIDEEDITLRGRVGFGGAYEFGSDDERFIPEALVGYDYENQLDERSRITSTGNLFLDLEEGDEFRSYWDLAYEIDMTDEGDWTLRVGVDHQYDSDSDVRPWDLGYYAALVYSF